MGKIEEPYDSGLLDLLGQKGGKSKRRKKHEGETPNIRHVRRNRKDSLD
jgi:hypothetical protein